MAIGDDFDISAAKVIDYTGAAHGASGAGYYTGIAFHRWAQDLRDDPAWSGDDVMDIVQQTPTDRQGIDQIIALINGFTITQAAVEHLYDCSIISSNSDRWDGMKVISGTDTDFELRITQNGAVISALHTEGNSFWNDTPFGAANPGLNPDPTNGVSTQFLLKVSNAGVDIDNRTIIGTTRVWGKTSSEFKINATALGVNPIPVTFRDDLNNTTVVGTVAGWTGITATTMGFAQIDVEADAAPEDFYSEWNTNQPTRSINDFTERMKWLSRSGETQDTDVTVTTNLTGAAETTINMTSAIATDAPDAGWLRIELDSGAHRVIEYTSFAASAFTIVSTDFTGDNASIGVDVFYKGLYGLDGELFRGITHEIDLGGADSGTFEVFEGVTWTGGTGQMLAIDNQTAASATKMWIQLLTGSAPTTELITATDSAATATATGNTERTISTPFFGTSTGSAIIGSYGFGIEAGDLTASDLVFDLTDTNIPVPNNVTFSVNGVIATEDRTLVARRGYVLDYDSQTVNFTLYETLTFGGSVTAKLNAMIDNGATGTIWIGETSSGVAPIDSETIAGASGDGNVTAGTQQNTIDLGVMAQNALVNGATTTTLVMAAAIPTDTPATGTVRVERTSGVYDEFVFSSYTSATFTLDLSTTGAIAMSVDEPSGEFRRASGSFLTDGFRKDANFTSTNFTNGGNNSTFKVLSIADDGQALTVTDNTGMVTEGAGADEDLTTTSYDFSVDTAPSGANVWAAYIDKLASVDPETVTIVFTANRTMFVRVADGGGSPIKTAETTGALTTTGGSATINRLADD